MDRARLDAWQAEVDALLKENQMPQNYEDVPDGEGGTDTVLVDRPALLIDSLINVPATEVDDATIVLIPRDEPIENYDLTTGDPLPAPDQTRFETETKAELQADLAERGLPTSGNKDELIARLEEDVQ